MKHLLLAALLAGLLAGCADKPIQEASIEDRAIGTRDGQTEAEATAAAAEQAAAEARAATLAGTDATGTRADGGREGDATASGVQTHAIAPQETEVRSIEGSAIADGGAGQPGEVLDPSDPAGPLTNRRILFDFDSAAIRDEYRPLLEAHAAYMKQEPKAEMILQGHTDDRGSREYNLALGQRRAESVLRALGLLGVAENRIEAVSMGEEKPIAEGQNEAAWSQNRRAEILYVGE